MLKSNRLRGTQKLKLYCQLCRKQCKDENGWKCHLNSHSHQANVREFAANPQANIEKYSEQFETNFIEMMRDKYPNVRKKANELYVEFIDDRNHIHMTATRWPTLTAFCEHLKSMKYIAVEEREQIYLTYLEVDAKEFKKQTDSNKHLKDKAKETQTEWKAMEEKILKAKAAEIRTKDLQPVEESDQEELQPGSISFKLNLATDEEWKRPPAFSTSQLQEQTAKDDGPIKYKKKCTNADKLLSMLRPKEKHAWDIVPEREEQPEEEEVPQQSWVIKGIMVKILPHDIDERFHNRKAVIVDVPEDFSARLECDGTTLEIDQSFLQTVVPKEGSPVIIVKGDNRGQRAVIDRIYPDQGYAILVFLRNGKEVALNLPCSDFSKAAN